MSDPLPPNPDAWRRASLAMDAAKDGAYGQLALGDVRYWVRRYRQGGDKYHVLFEFQAVSDPEFEALADGLARRVQG